MAGVGKSKKMGKATGGTRQAALGELTNAPRVAVNTKVMPLNFTVLLPLLISHYSNGNSRVYHSNIPPYQPASRRCIRW